MTKTIRGHKRSVESFNSIDVSTYDVATPASNTVARIIYAADDSHQHVINGVAWSYDGQLAGGQLRILDGADVIFDVDIVNSGFNAVYFNYPKRGSINRALVIELTAGGVGVSGKVNALAHWLE